MNNKYHQLMVKEAAKDKFHGSQPLKSKVTPRYPESAEREFQRIARGYLKILNQLVKDHVPKMMAMYKKERHGDSRFDDAQDLDAEVRQEMQRIAEELEQKIAEYGLAELVEKVGDMARNASVREWKRVIHETLGIDLLDDYYKGDFYDQVIRKWIDENVIKIKSIPNDTLSSMREIIRSGYMSGESIRDISKAIQKEYNHSKSKAVMLARDQVATLNAQMTKLQQQDAGCDEYVWSDSRDSRVRDCHKSLNGKTFNWNDPPEMWYDTKERGRVFTGRRCHPGEDYCCRCVAIPKFNIETLNVPMKQTIEDDLQ